MRARLLRPALAAGLLGLVATAGLAGAATKPVCNLLKDDKGDGTAFLVGDGTPSDPAWDIVSADIASSGSKLTTVIRVDELATAAATSPGGVQWRFNFTVGDVSLYTSVRADTLLGITGSYGYVSTISETLGQATPVLDTAKNEVRITVPLSGFSSVAPIKKTGTSLGSLEATAGRFYNLGAVTASEPSDSADGASSYVTGTRSCVVVGK